MLCASARVVVAMCEWTCVCPKRCRRLSNFGDRDIDEALKTGSYWPCAQGMHANRDPELYGTTPADINAASGNFCSLGSAAHCPFPLPSGLRVRHVPSLSDVKARGKDVLRSVAAIRAVTELSKEVDHPDIALRAQSGAGRKHTQAGKSEYYWRRRRVWQHCRQRVGVYVLDTH
jgi:hypothetical protein